MDMSVKERAAQVRALAESLGIAVRIPGAPRDEPEEPAVEYVAHRIGRDGKDYGPGIRIHTPGHRPQSLPLHAGHYLASEAGGAALRRAMERVGKG